MQVYVFYLLEILFSMLTSINITPNLRAINVVYRKKIYYKSVELSHKTDFFFFDNEQLFYYSNLRWLVTIPEPM